MTKLISNQRFLDDAIVEEKRAAADYAVSVSPAFEVFGEKVRLILDGHHSFHAAIMDGAEADIIELTASDDDRIGLLEAGDVEAFLDATYIDADLYDVYTGQDL